jgi:hypothetical protein
VTHSIRAAVEYLQQAVQHEVPGAPPLEEVRLVFVGGRRMKLAIFSAVSAPAPSAEPASAEDDFTPNALQADVLIALERKALRTDALARAIGCDRTQLFRKPGGVQELRDHGLLDNHPGHGYFRPDLPPPELSK